jgi:hypothetical protein
MLKKRVTLRLIRMTRTNHGLIRSVKQNFMNWLHYFRNTLRPA